MTTREACPRTHVSPARQIPNPHSQGWLPVLFKLFIARQNIGNIRLPVFKIHEINGIKQATLCAASLVLLAHVLVCLDPESLDPGVCHTLWDLIGLLYHGCIGKLREEGSREVSLSKGRDDHDDALPLHLGSATNTDCSLPTRTGCQIVPK